MRLRNATRVEQTFNLPHGHYCKGGPCACSKTTLRSQEPLPDGKTGVRSTERLVCASVTFLAGETKDVDVRVRAVPEVKAALDRGDLRELKS